MLKLFQSIYSIQGYVALFYASKILFVAIQCLIAFTALFLVIPFVPYVVVQSDGSAIKQNCRQCCAKSDLGNHPC